MLHLWEKLRRSEIGFNAAARELQCPESSSSTTASRLRSELLCDYDSFIRPVKDHRNATTVSFRLLLKYFNYDHFSHMLSVDAWFTTFWIDQHLKWKPEDYEGIKTIHLSSSYDIWVPDLSVYNRKDQSSEPKAIGDTMCAVNYQGTVLCVPPLHLDALCVPDLKRYPYDFQKCTVRFGSWVHKGEEINLKIVKPIVDIEDMEPNGEWELVSFEGIKHRGNYTCCPNSTYPSIDVIFEIRRHSSAHAINVVLPLLVCISLTIVTMMMSPLNRDRLTVCCVNFIVHIFHVQNLSYMIPLSGDNVPGIVRISRDSALLTGVSIIATIFLKYLMESKSTSPAWMSGTVSVLTGTRPGQLIFLPDNSLKGAAVAENQEDGARIISSSGTLSDSPTADWMVFGKFLHYILLIIYILTYFILLVSF